MKGHEQGSSPRYSLITPDIIKVECYYVAAPLTPLVPPFDYPYKVVYIDAPDCVHLLNLMVNHI